MGQPLTGFTVRPERAEDRVAVRAVVGAAFGDDLVPRLLDGLRASSAWRDLSYVAEAGPDVIGHVSYTRAWIDAPYELVEVLVLSPLSVRPDLQGWSVGSRLVRETLTMLRGRPEPLVFLEGSPAYYARFGFEPGGRHGFTAPSVRIPDAAFQVVMLPSYDDGLTGALVYPEVFWEYDAVGLRDPA